jgi:transcription initiation factor TFIID TATA-box-binding protein
MTNVKIENIVAYAQVCDALDMELISEKIPETIYNPEQFPGVSWKFDEPKVAILILPTGRIVCTGASKPDDVENVIKKVVSRIKKIGFEIKKGYTVETENVIASVDFKKEMHLSSIANGLLLKHVDYEPKYFPGLIYRLEDKDAVLLLFSSGKLVCTGAKSVEDAKSVIETMEEKLTSLGAL